MSSAMGALEWNRHTICLMTDPSFLAANNVLREFTTEAERYIEVARRRHQLAHNDVHALAAIIEEQDAGRVLTPGGLRRRLILSPSATTALIDRMVHMGLVGRHGIPGDGRTVGLLVTDLGRVHGRRMFVELGAHIGQALGAYEPEQVELLMRMLVDLTGATRRARQELADADAPPTGEPPTG